MGPAFPILVLAQGAGRGEAFWACAVPAAMKRLKQAKESRHRIVMGLFPGVPRGKIGLAAKNKQQKNADRVGFEPTEDLRLRLFSRQFRYDHSGTCPRGASLLYAAGASTVKNWFNTERDICAVTFLRFCVRISVVLPCGPPLTFMQLVPAAR